MKTRTDLKALTSQTILHRSRRIKAYATEQEGMYVIYGNLSFLSPFIRGAESEYAVGECDNHILGYVDSVDDLGDTWKAVSDDPEYFAIAALAEKMGSEDMLRALEEERFVSAQEAMDGLCALSTKLIALLPPMRSGHVVEALCHEHRGSELVMAVYDDGGEPLLVCLQKTTSGTARLRSQAAVKP